MMCVYHLYCLNEFKALKNNQTIVSAFKKKRVYDHFASIKLFIDYEHFTFTHIGIHFTLRFILLHINNKIFTCSYD